MSSQDGSVALQKARQLMTAALAPNSTSLARRTFYEHLISLPFFPSYECKAFFGTLVAKFFAEFEDLQDGAIDALLDLCEDEDEKVRIIGIKGLGPTGKADPKWVRGNTGVLLQLLACQARELRHVREALNTLIGVSGAEVFSVMSDDCKGSEEETGASRRNILDFLYQSTEMRKEVLESGSNLDAERAFKEGFVDVLPAVGEEDRKDILDMLSRLSTVGGRNADERTRGGFWRSIVGSIPRNPGGNRVLPVLKTLVECAERLTPFDARYMLLFVASHGPALVDLALTNKESTTKTFVDKLEGWMEGAISRWHERDAGHDKDLAVQTLGPGFVSAILPTLLKVSDRLYDEDKLAQWGVPLEQLIYAIYRLTLYRDQRPSISSKDGDGLLDLCSDADKAERRTVKGSAESQALKNIADMAEVLGEPKRSFRKITPSWRTPRAVPQPRAGPSASSKPPSRPPTPPHAPRGPRNEPKPPSAPRQASSFSATPATSSSRIPTAPSSSAHPPKGPRNSSPRPSKAKSPERPPTPPLPPPPARNPQVAIPAARPPTPPRLPVAEVKRPITSSAGLSIRDSAREPLPPKRDTPKVEKIVTLLAARLGAVAPDSANGISIRSSANTTEPAKSTPELTIKSRSQPRPQPTAGPQALSTPTPVSTETKRTPSLAERLGISPAQSSSSTPPSNKRIRDSQQDETISTNGSPIPKNLGGNGTATAIATAPMGKGRPSLLSRLAARDEPISKRSKNDMEPPSLGSRLSLRDRMNGSAPAHAPDANVGSVLIDAPTNGVRDQPKGFSILNRSTSTSTSTPGSGSGAGSGSAQPNPPLQGLSILARASTASTTSPIPPQGLSIRRTSSTLAPSPTPTAPAVLATDVDEGEEVIVRKGRGFRAPSPVRDVIMSMSDSAGEAEAGMGMGMSSQVQVQNGGRGMFGGAVRGLRRPNGSGRRFGRG